MHDGTQGVWSLKLDPAVSGIPRRYHEAEALRDGRAGLALLVRNAAAVNRQLSSMT